MDDSNVDEELESTTKMSQDDDDDSTSNTTVANSLVSELTTFKDSATQV